MDEWLREHEDAPGAEAPEAEAEKGHAADQPSGKKAAQAQKEHAADQPSGEKAAQAEKGHAADEPSGGEAAQAEKGHAADEPSGEKAAQAAKGHAGDKATQGSGGSTQKLWSEPARKKAPHSSVGQPVVEEWSEWSEESDTIAHGIRAVRGRERTPEPDRQVAREEAQRKMHARKAEDKKIFDGLKRRTGDEQRRMRRT